MNKEKNVIYITIYNFLAGVSVGYRRDGIYQVGLSYFGISIRGKNQCMR